MRVYYRGPDALVTSEAFVWFDASAQTFTLRDLRNVCITRKSADRTGIYLFAGLLLAGSAVATWFTTPWVLLSVLLLVPLLMWRSPGRWDLLADYHGRPATLYSSRDERVFHQVSRALRRALEDGGGANRQDAA